MFAPTRALLSTARRVFASRADLLLENLALRHQLAVYQRRQARPQLRQQDRLIWILLSRLWSRWRDALLIVQPDTVLRWHHHAWKRYWSFKSRHRGPGRPRISAELRRLILRMAQENPRWGTKRIRGEVLALGFEVGAETVRRYRIQAGRRPPSQTWRTFLANHAPHIWACDFFTIHTLTFQTLYVFFLIEHGSRAIVHFNVTQHPTAEWTWRQIIEATPWGKHPRFLIRDRDACYGKAFVGRAKTIGIETIVTPFRAPQANSIAERMVGTFRRECLDHIIVLNERHLRVVLGGFVEHYNGSRPHQSLADTPPVPVPRLLRPSGPARVVARSVLGGLHHEYRWEAAG